MVEMTPIIFKNFFKRKELPLKIPKPMLPSVTLKMGILIDLADYIKMAAARLWLYVLFQYLSQKI